MSEWVRQERTRGRGRKHLVLFHTVPEVRRRAGCKVSVARTLPALQCESVLAGVTVVILWPSAGKTGAMTQLTLPALLIHKGTVLTVIHTRAAWTQKNTHFECLHIQLKFSFRNDSWFDTFYNLDVSDGRQQMGNLTGTVKLDTCCIYILKPDANHGHKRLQFTFTP